MNPPVFPTCGGVSHPFLEDVGLFQRRCTHSGPPGEQVQDSSSPQAIFTKAEAAQAEAGHPTQFPGLPYCSVFLCSQPEGPRLHPLKVEEACRQIGI